MYRAFKTSSWKPASEEYEVLLCVTPTHLCFHDQDAALAREVPLGRVASLLPVPSELDPRGCRLWLAMRWGSGRFKCLRFLSPIDRARFVESVYGARAELQVPPVQPPLELCVAHVDLQAAERGLWQVHTWLPGAHDVCVLTFTHCYTGAPPDFVGSGLQWVFVQVLLHWTRLGYCLVDSFEFLGVHGMLVVCRRELLWRLSPASVTWIAALADAPKREQQRKRASDSTTSSPSMGQRAAHKPANSSSTLAREAALNRATRELSKEAASSGGVFMTVSIDSGAPIVVVLLWSDACQVPAELLGYHNVWVCGAFQATPKEVVCASGGHVVALVHACELEAVGSKVDVLLEPVTAVETAAAAAAADCNAALDEECFMCEAVVALFACRGCNLLMCDTCLHGQGLCRNCGGAPSSTEQLLVADEPSLVELVADTHLVRPDSTADAVGKAAGIVQVRSRASASLAATPAPLDRRNTVAGRPRCLAACARWAPLPWAAPSASRQRLQLSALRVEWASGRAAEPYHLLLECEASFEGPVETDASAEAAWPEPTSIVVWMSEEAMRRRHVYVSLVPASRKLDTLRARVPLALAVSGPPCTFRVPFAGGAAWLAGQVGIVRNEFLLF